MPGAPTTTSVTPSLSTSSMPRAIKPNSSPAASPGHSWMMRTFSTNGHTKSAAVGKSDAKRASPRIFSICGLERTVVKSMPLVFCRAEYTRRVVEVVVVDVQQHRLQVCLARNTWARDRLFKRCDSTVGRTKRTVRRGQRHPRQTVQGLRLQHVTPERNASLNFCCAMNCCASVNFGGVAGVPPACAANVDARNTSSNNDNVDCVFMTLGRTGCRLIAATRIRIPHTRSQFGTVRVQAR